MNNNELGEALKKIGLSGTIEIKKADGTTHELRLGSTDLEKQNEGETSNGDTSTSNSDS
jgi:hypothetical protein